MSKVLSKEEMLELGDKSSQYLKLIDNEPQELTYMGCLGQFDGMYNGNPQLNKDGSPRKVFRYKFLSSYGTEKIYDNGKLNLFDEFSKLEPNTKIKLTKWKDAGKNKFKVEII